MNATQVCRLILICGFLMFGVTDVHGKHFGKSNRNKSNGKKADSEGLVQKVNYKSLSKQLLKRLDSSCRFSVPPDIPNGNLFRLKINKFEEGSKAKYYMIAEYKCNEGYKFRGSHPKKLFCSKKKWVGKKPICDEVGTDSDILQSDDPNVPSQYLHKKECAPEDRGKCKHLCSVNNNGTPQCDCLPGFEKDGNDCKDIDECKTDNGGCQHVCTNHLGSFTCSCKEGFRLSTDGKTCEDVNECHLRNGHGPCQDTCENTYGSYKCFCMNLKGTRLAPDLHTCSDVNECTEGISGCSHSCVNTHGKAFCTCPDGMELGPDWKTCLDINECDNPEIRDTCLHGCVNVVGSYYCKEFLHIIQSDQPTTDQETVAEYVEDEYEDEDYENGDYEDDDEDYKDEENGQLTTTEDSEINVIEHGKEADEDNTIHDNYSSSIKETEITNSIHFNETFIEKENAKYGDKIYDDKDNEHNNENIENNIDEINKYLATENVTGTQINRTGVLIDVTNSSVTENNEMETENSTENTRSTNNNIHMTSNVTTYQDLSNTISNTEIPLKEIQNRQDENVADYEIQHNTESSKEGEPSSQLNRRDNTTSPKTEIREKISTDDEYDDEDYDDEYYDGDSNDKEKSVEDIEEDETRTENSITEKLPEVDIDQVNEDIHGIIESSTQTIFYTTEEIIIDTTSKSMQSKDDSDKEKYDEYEDYEEEDRKGLKKEESELAGKEFKKCEKGYILAENAECSDLDECKVDVNPCSDGCTNTAGSYQCTCPTGFTISSSDPHSCEDVNECMETPCSHSCINELGSFHCECPPELILQNNTCVSLNCSQGQTKINGVLQCTCHSGFVLGTDGRSCEDVDECQLDAHCSHICRNTIGSFECACELGYMLTNETTCVDIDECKISHECPQLCENIPGSFKCSCEEGYEYHEQENACIDINECDNVLDLDECTQICVNYEGGYECACYDGYKLGSDDATCEDINECSTNNGNCSHICTNQPGTYQCDCNIGYKLSSDNVTCEISDPCLIDNGGCSHQCMNENGVAVCKCPEGQVLEDKNCFKIDPCVANNGGCSHICVNANGAVRCECPDDYELENETNCVQINPCTINNGNCSHFCEFVEGHLNCLCPDLHVLHNITNCIEVNPCLEDNGGCSHTCNFQNHTVVCSCPVTHELRNDTHCFQKNPCLTDNGGCSDTCLFSNNVLSCSCPENYYLEGKTCYRIDPCLTNNGGCSHECLSDDEGQIECVCPDDYFLKLDNKTCLSKNPCIYNNGNCSHICESSTGIPLCSCPDGFTLKNKTICEEFNPCSVENGGCSHFCDNIKGQAICFCPESYILQNSTNCVLIDPCQENNGGCSHECVNENGKAVCLCPEGYQLRGRKCIAVNPCLKKNGGCSHVCTSINNQVICKCPPGHELINKTCFKINPCLVNNGGCSHNCNDVNGQVKCSCPPGYKLFGKKCADEDPCSKNNGGCSHYCHNKEGRKECTCPSGYVLRPNKRVCKEINECKINRGGCSHGCKNLPGSYQCTCPQGFSLDKSNNKTCVDIDECQTNNGNCHMYCRNFNGGFKCECPEGYVIQKDTRSCKLNYVAATCPIPTTPKNGIMRCSDQNTELNRSVPPGTRCHVWCNEGFKMEGSQQRVCNDSGIWEGEEPFCVVSSCPSLPDIQNGWYLPGVCNSGKVYLGESCKVHCRKGYRRNLEFHRYICGEDLQWSPQIQADNLSGACIKDVSNVYIKCPGNGVLDFVLPPGQREMLVQIPRPDSNVDFSRYVTSYPSWGVRLEARLSAGTEDVRFTAMAPGDFNNSASCTLRINVVDKESPRMMGCPENLERTLMSSENMQIVHWREPTFYDNVGIASVYKSREPGSEFGLGLHHISYVASDESGNRAFCHFTVNIKSEPDGYDSESANSIRHAMYTNHHSAGMYRAVLMCPSGVQYMSNSPDSYNNMLTSEAGCYWRHVRVTRPMQPQSFRIPRVHSESRLPANVRSNRRTFFKWSK